jgi:hypothetical protein
LEAVQTATNGIDFLKGSQPEEHTMAMFDLDQKVIVINDKGIAYEATILARAKSDSTAPGAYQVAMLGVGADKGAQWHKASDVFAPEPTAQEKKDSWNDFLKE